MFDSGLGGLSVLAEIRRLRPDVEIVYAADDAAFPYGRLSESALVARVETVMARLIGETEPDIVVIACSTASTLALPPLQGRLSAPAFRRHRAGDQAGGGGVAIRTDQRTGDARDRRARLHPRAGARSRRRLRGDAGGLVASRAHRRTHHARRGGRGGRESRARSRRASSNARAGARTMSCSPAPTFPSSSTSSSGFPPGRSPSSIRRRRSRAASTR